MRPPRPQRKAHAMRTTGPCRRYLYAALAEGGYLPAEAADSVYGPHTRRTLAAYQMKLGLAVNEVGRPLPIPIGWIWIGLAVLGWSSSIAPLVSFR